MVRMLLASAVAFVVLVCLVKACQAQPYVPCPAPCINPYAVLPSLPSLGYVPNITAPTPYANPSRPYQPPTVYVSPSGQTQCQTINEVTYCTR